MANINHLRNLAGLLTRKEITCSPYRVRDFPKELDSGFRTPDDEMANSPATCIGVFSNSVCGCCALRRCQSAYQWQTPRTCLEFRDRCQGCCRTRRPLPKGWKDLEEMEAEAFTGSFFLATSSSLLLISGKCWEHEFMTCYQTTLKMPVIETSLWPTLFLLRALLTPGKCQVPGTSLFAGISTQRVYI